MIKEIRYPYKNLTNVERERIELFRGYHLIDYKDIHVYFCTELSLGVGYNIIVSLHKFKKSNEIEFNDVTKDITDVDNLIDNF
jgi:hypothetical protein